MHLPLVVASRSGSQSAVKNSSLAVATSLRPVPEHLTNRANFAETFELSPDREAGPVLELARPGPAKGPGKVNDEASQSRTCRTPEGVRDGGARNSGSGCGSPRGCERPDPGNRHPNARRSQSI